MTEKSKSIAVWLALSINFIVQIIHSLSLNQEILAFFYVVALVIGLTLFADKKNYGYQRAVSAGFYTPNSNHFLHAVVSVVAVVITFLSLGGLARELDAENFFRSIPYAVSVLAWSTYLWLYAPLGKNRIKDARKYGL